MTVFHCESAWLGGAASVADVAVTVTDGVIASVEAGVAVRPSDERLRGVVIPGLANVHSHAFHRALRGWSQTGRGDFWTWRQGMYRVAAGLDPDAYLRLARATYAEMALAGITAVGEFHYLHHGPGGVPYEDPNEMGHALVAAAADAGLRLTLLDTCYLRSGFDGAPLDPVQERFSDRDPEAWADRFSAMCRAASSRDRVLVGAAVHSVRAVGREDASVVAAAARVRRVPLHVHVSEQPTENEACVEATGMTPTALLEVAGALGERTVAVHATHLTDDDIATLGRRRVQVCFCPTTERDLADGIGPAEELVAAGCSLSLGSDSHAVIDLFEEARAVELDDRLRTGRRGAHSPASLLASATAAGHRALGLPGGSIVVGAPADLVAVSRSSVRLAGTADGRAAAHLVFAAAAADVTDVVVAGRRVVQDGVHLSVPHVGAELHAAIGAVLS